VYCDNTAHLRGVAIAIGGRYAGGVRDSALQSERLEADASDALADEAELLGGSVGDVDDAAAAEGPAIGHLDHHRIAIRQIGDAQLGAKGEAAMGGGQCALQEHLTAGGALSLMALAIEGGISDVGGPAGQGECRKESGDERYTNLPAGHRDTHHAKRLGAVGNGPRLPPNVS